MATVERFVCDVPGCGKSFDTQAAYAGHVGFHKLSGTYPCPECALEGIERVFALPQGLGAHRLASHGVRGTAAKNVRLRNKKKDVKQVQAAFPEPVRATDVPPMKVVQIPPGVLRVGEAPVPALAERVTGTVTTNGGDPIEQEIREAFAPLIARYTALQARQVELMAEMEHNTHDLTELWKVLGLGVDLSVELTPPPMQLGVQVAFQKKVSDSLRERGEEWLALRKQSFTSSDMARAIGVSTSTATNMIAEYRDEAKVRLVGKRGRAKTYLSTVGAR